MSDASLAGIARRPAGSATQGTTPPAQQGSPARNPAASRPRPHVCFVAPEAWPVFSGNTDISVVGGAEVQQSILARGLAAAGYRVSMLCLDFGQAPEVLMDGVRVIRTYRPDAGLPVLRFVHPRSTRMWSAMAQVDADIYYQRSAGMLTALVAAFCRRHGKRSIYAGASNSDFVPGQQMIRYRRDRWLFEQGLAAVDAVVVQNEQQRQDCREHYGREAIQIPSCYAPPASSQPRLDGEAGDYVLWVGTLRYTKRPELFVDLARRLPQRRFVLIGGPDDNEPESVARFQAVREAAAGLPNLEVTGFLPLAQVEPWFDRAQVVVNTSIFEGMPNVFLQAWARGIPTVAYIDTGSRLDGEPIYPSVASQDEAAATIERLCADAPYRARTGGRCRDYFEQTHGRTRVIARYMDLFDRLQEGGA